MDASTPLALFGDNSTMLLSVLVFLSCGTLAFAVMLGVRARQAVRRRAATVRPDHDRGDGDAPHSRFAVARKLVDYTTKHYASEGKDTKVLRNRMLQAGVYEPHAVAYFFIARTGMALGIAVVLIFVLPLLGMGGKSSFWLCVMLGGLLGYLAPGYYLDRRIAARRAEHRSGFPDFMDLLVICADAGLAMEAALDRVRAELAGAYPSLAANLHIANLEIRAGRTLSEALEHFGDRVGIEEARSFATLLQQSGELGTSISSALRVYSDDMRHKRMSRAEEKAYSLPAKLAVPMMVCIFPVLFVVILTPVIVRLATGNW
jgi:tight adherence protein C